MNPCRQQTCRWLDHVISCVVMLPVSTAECERGFSHMNLICDELRSTVTMQHLSALMFVSLVGLPTTCVESWNISTVLASCSTTKCSSDWLSKPKSTRDNYRPSQTVRVEVVVTAFVISDVKGLLECNTFLTLTVNSLCISMARVIAYSSARKILALFAKRTALVEFLVTAAEDTWSPTFEPSVYNRWKPS